MAMTTEARTQLLAEIVPHTDASGAPLKGVLLPNGMLKTKRGLIIQPSMMRDGNVHLAQLTPEELEICGMKPEQNVQQKQPPAPAPAPEPAKKSRSRKKQQAEDFLPVRNPTYSVPRLYVDRLGSVPTSQYADCIVGKGVIVLGIRNGSEAFIPELPKDDPSPDKFPIVRTSPADDKKFVFMGHEFTMGDIRYIVLMQLPQR